MITPIERKVGTPILISDKTDFRASKFIRDKEGHHLMIKTLVLQEDLPNP